MKMDIHFFAIICFLLCSASATDDGDKVKCRPEQVHIAYGDTVGEMVVMWATVEACSTELQYGAHPWGGKDTVMGDPAQPIPGDTSHVPYQHRVKLTGLQAEETYFYIPISNTISNGVFYFKTLPLGTDWSPEFLVYGDLGVHAASMPKLKLEALTGDYAAILHVGDFGYNLFETITEPPNLGQNASVAGSAAGGRERGIVSTPPPHNHTNTDKVGDVFMRQIQEMASHVPYMVSPGNHEIEDDTFWQYRYRFSTPNTDWPIPLTTMFYSIDIGPVHYVSYSSEVFFVADGQYVETQRNWLQRDLQEANKRRHTVPWIIAAGHRPMYCSNADGDDCTKADSFVRQGLEDIFYENGVDVVLQAHEHSYERLWPMYKGVVLAYNYTDPPAPVQLVTGAAGQKHGVDDFNSTLNETWSAFRMDNRSFNSFGRLKVHNGSHLYWEQVAVFGGEVLDSIWVTQTAHGPFKQTALQPEQKEKIQEQKKIDDELQKKRNKKPKIAGDSLTEKVSKAIQGIDIKVIVGVSFAVFVVLFLCIVCIVRKCRKRPKSYRRWETLDYGKKFYTNLKHDDKDMDDFEVDVTDGTTKLIDSSKD